MLRSTLSKSRSKLFPSKTKEKEAEEVLDPSGPKTPILDAAYKENTTVEENDDEDFGSFSYDDDEYYSESDLEPEQKREKEEKYSRLDRIRRSRSRSRSFSRSRSRSRSESKSRWEEEEAEENNVRRRKPTGRPTTEGVVKRSGKQPIEESPRCTGERSKRGSRADEEQKRYMRIFFYFLNYFKFFLKVHEDGEIRQGSGHNGRGD